MTLNSNTNVARSAEIDLRYYWYILRSRWLVVLATAIGAGLVALIASLLLEPVYRSGTTIYVDARSSEGTASINDLRISESLARTYSELITSRSILEKVLIELDLPISVGSLSGSIDASPIANTQLIKIQVEHPDPNQSAAIANVVSQVLIKEIQDIETSGYTTSEDNLTSQLDYLDVQIANTQANIDALGQSTDSDDVAERNRLETLIVEYNKDYSPLIRSREEVRLAKFESSSNMRVVEQAIAPRSPIQPRIPFNVAVAVLLGTITSIVFIFGRELLDDTIRNPEELSQRFSLPILGQVVNFDAENEKLITLLKPRSPISEAFRSLRLNLKYTGVDKQLKSILITSASPSEGKSTLAANLSIVLAQGDQDIILVDGDLRKPKVHKNFQLKNHDGMSGLFLRDLETLSEALQDTTVPKLSVITSGALPPNPSKLLDSEKASQIIEKATEVADTVVIDAPPLIAMTDAAALSQHVDGVILVVRAGSTRHSAVEQALQRLNQVGANVLGFTITDIDNVFEKSSYYYYQYQEYYKSYGAYYDEDDRNGTGSSKKKKKLKSKAATKNNRKGSLERITSVFKS